MSKIIKVLISFAASLGFGLLLASILAMVSTMNAYRQGNSNDRVWDTYLKSFYTYEGYSFYFSSFAFVLLFLFYVIQIHKKSPWL